ncbi:hypothetical protein [Oscillatoria sp. FACHB-1406]|uniref:hypothetical protein n=1 Tax=Oscillatoria sp. FACHB-1406 TaxID=2692846 RepID=UPI001688BB5D|nr:hypothetical protein [Oscillatoria sp. FACHB-1406]MBD2577451.1 hypothetical protein [Oscillatoria sp. FACHB-1406]
MTYPENRPTNPNESENFEETINGRPATDSEVAYRDGYVSGTANEREIQSERALVNERNQVVRDNENAGRGLLLGLLLAGLLGAGALAYYLANREEPAPVPATNTIVVPDKEATPSPSAAEPKKDTTVIERTIEKTNVVPVPTQPAQPPKVEVNTPPPAPAPKVDVNVSPAAPAPAPKVDVNVSPAAPAPSAPSSAAPSAPSSVAPSAPSSVAPPVPDSSAPGSSGSGSSGSGSSAPGTSGSGSN